MSVAAVLVLYAVFLGIGIAGARKASGGDWSDLLVAGRAMPLWLAVLTMTATWVDGGYLLGTVEGTFKSGLPLGAQGGLCFGVEPDPRRPLLRPPDAAARVHDAHRSVRGALRQAVGGGARGAGAARRDLLERRAARRHRVHVRRDARRAAHLGDRASRRSSSPSTPCSAGMWSVAYTDAFQLGPGRPRAAGRDSGRLPRGRRGVRGLGVVRGGAARPAHRAAAAADRRRGRAGPGRRS